MYQEIINHYKKNWSLENVYFITLEKGPMKIYNPHFTILVNPPTDKRKMWTSGDSTTRQRQQKNKNKEYEYKLVIRRALL